MAVPVSSERYQAISPAEFFYKYREIAGFSNPARALYQTIRELVENALDATDAHGILPNVKVVIRRADEENSYYKVIVEDNGTGIPPHIVPEAFGRVLFSSKYILRQTRGMFGLGAKVAILYGQITTGQPVEVITSQRGLKRIYYFKLRIDINKNEPEILERGSYRKNRDWAGTIVSVTVEGDWAKARHRIREYILRTAVVTPYANIVFISPEGEVLFFKRSIDKLPRPPREVKPHPYGIDLEVLKRLRDNSAFPTIYDLLTKSFQSIGDVTARKILELSGIEASAEPKRLSDKELLRLANIMKQYGGYRPPTSAALSPLGEDVVKAGLQRIYQPEFVDAVTRRPAAFEGHPFIVEAGIAYGGKVPMSSDKYPTLLRYANKIPLLYDEGSDVITKIVRDEVNWENYHVHLPAPVVVLVHLCSTKIPFKGVGKESIADVEVIHREIKLAILDVARRLRNYLSKKIREEEKRKRLVNIAKYIPEITRALAVILDEDGVPHDKLLHRLAEVVSIRTGVPREEVLNIIKNVEIGV